MSMSPETGGQILTPEQEFNVAKEKADKLFAEISYEIARAITSPYSIAEIARMSRDKLEPKEKYKGTGIGYMHTAIDTYITGCFEKIDGESRRWIDEQPEFARVATLLKDSKSEDHDTKRMQERYKRPADTLHSNFLFLTDHFMTMHHRHASHATSASSLADAQRVFRQIAKLHDYQQKHFDTRDELAWNDILDKLHIVDPGGMPAVRKRIEQDIEIITLGTGLPNPHPPYPYQRGCAALRKPEGETDDAFDVMWKWCVAAVTDPRLQHLLIGTEETPKPIGGLA
jgi:hypothetical protein